MTEFRRSMRAVLPPLWISLLGVALSYGTRGAIELLKWASRPASDTEFSMWHLVLEAEPTQRTFGGVFCFVAAVYGAWRVLGRHPVARPRYRAWLIGTPWRWPDSLPAGPLLPAWQDLVVLAVLTIPTIGLPFLPVLASALAALIAYSLIALLIAAFSRRPSIECIAGFWTAAAMLYFRDTPPVVGICSAVLLASACIAIVADLRKLASDEQPWTAGWLIPSAIEQHGPLGWPHDALAPHPLQPHSTGFRLAMALTVGLAVTAIRPAKDMLAFEVQHFVVIAGAAIAFVRFVVYATLAGPRLNLARRFRFGRFVSLRSDSLTLSSCAIVLAGYLLPSIVLQLPTTGMNQFAVAITILLALAFCLPPSRETWRLTSHARLPRNRNRANKRRSVQHSLA